MNNKEIDEMRKLIKISEDYGLLSSSVFCLNLALWLNEKWNNLVAMLTNLTARGET